MDDLEFRRRVFADPKSKDVDVQQAASDDPARQAFLSDMRQFDDKISAALNKVDIPENLAERLILRQAIDSHQQSKRRFRISLALAASVAFAIGISIQMFNPFSANFEDHNTLGSHSLGHLVAELNHYQDVDENNSIDQVNAKLARFGAQLKHVNAQNLGKSLFANYCDFAGVTSLHLVYDSPEGRMSVFITPAETPIAFESNFGNENYVGKGLKFNKAHISVVGEKNNAQAKQAVDQFSQKISQSIEWKI